MHNQQTPTLKDQLEAIKKGGKRRSMNNLRLKRLKTSFKTKETISKTKLTDLLR